MKRIMLAGVLLWGVWMVSWGMDYQSLSDTLNYFAHQQTKVGTVKVKNVRMKGANITVYTNPVLSHVSFSEEQVRQIRIVVSEVLLGNKRGKVTIYSDGYELGELITSRFRHRKKADRYILPEVTPWVTNLSRPYTPTQGLEGKHLALWGSHGRYYLQSQETWKWQRAKLWTTVEDVYTTSYVMPFLVPMLENAGAIVVQPRERDTQIAEEVIDEGKAVREGEWKEGEALMGWGEKEGPLFEEENPFRMGTYYVANGSVRPNATLRYQPKFSAIGNGDEYAVYVSYKTLPNSTDKAQYCVVHKGEKTMFSVNQKMGGGTWVYLGTFAFDRNDESCNYVELTNASNAKQVVTADAVKFGGGMGSVARYQQPDLIISTKFNQDWQANDTMVIDSMVLRENMSRASTSGFPRWLEGSRYWLQYAGIPDSVYSYTRHKNDYTDDYSSRGRWVNYLAGGSAANPHEPGLGVPLCFSMAFHTDAGQQLRDEMVGTLQIYTDHDNDNSKTFPTGASRQLNRDLSDYIQTQIVNDMRKGFNPNWTRRLLWNQSYAESRYPKVPSTLIELLSHQNQVDMVWGLDPRVKFAISRAIYKGLLRFLAEQAGTECVVQPLPVKQFRISRKQNDWTLTWQNTPDELEPTANASYYIVYTRMDNGDWDNGEKVSKNTFTLTPKKGVRYDFKVVAGNAGGVSMSSEILSAYISPTEKARMLIVNAFDRVSGPDWFYDSTYAGIVPDAHAVSYKKDVSYIGQQFQFDPTCPWTSDDNAGWGECFADQQTELTAGNEMQYPVMHGKVLSGMGISYVSTSASALEEIDSCDIADVIMGKQRTYILGTDTSFHCFPGALQQVLSSYLQKGGKMLISGNYIASDMRGINDTAFVHQQLHYAYRNQHATRNGKVHIERGLENKGAVYGIRTAPSNQQDYSECTDGLIPANGGQYIARYADSGMGACIGYTNDAQNQTICWGFMLESSDDFATLYTQSIEWLMKK